ncbi:DinB family protein [Microlunatus parietis]|uniref:Putative damage-inducible protein DinB n=1 Tax=Microlunatus parietis TaxID=682979 RepID=A0A7Y9I552_9ACTN|nr:DinB family protein [Microlunatus parietis]NYE70464.1 putative damage-inducible protein DinB [Microlunatus parietis]
MTESTQVAQELPERSFGWWDMWVSPEDDPRDDSTLVGERAVLTGYLRNYRLTLELKCSGLDAQQLARRSVPPSNLSLLGLVRHLTEVERYWFRKAMAGEDVPELYVREGEDDWDIDGAVADPAVVEEAWQNWRAEVKYGEEFVAAATDLGMNSPDGENNLRDVLVHLIEEYCRHMGHADLIRERIDGRVGQ